MSELMQLPRFLAVQVGDLVAVDGPLDQPEQWWIGQVIHAEGGARCNANSLFQIACLDSGVIRTVNANAVRDILRSAPGDAQSPPSAATNRPGPPAGRSS